MVKHANMRMFQHLSHGDIHTITRLFVFADKDEDGYVSPQDMRDASAASAVLRKGQMTIYFPESSVKDLRLSLLDLLKFNNAQRECGWID